MPTKIIVADYASIEGRVTAWLADEAWKLQAFRDNDAGVGPGMYELTAAGIYNCPVAEIGKKDPRRQVGKVSELALGFQGGVMAFDAMAKVYNLDMADAYQPLRLSVDGAVWEKAEKWYEVCLGGGKYGTAILSREAWLASEVTKRMWRGKHPATVALWRGLEEAAREAVLNPGVVYTYGKIRYVVRGSFLWCRLPSGRCLAYGMPRVEPRVWVDLEDGTSETMSPADAERIEQAGLGKVRGETTGAVTALGVDSQTKKYRRFALYGGLATENCVQGAARDVMVAGMLAAEDAGYPSILTVHDEVGAEVDEAFGSVAEYEALLCRGEDWMAGLPITASGYEAPRYKKD